MVPRKREAGNEPPRRPKLDLDLDMPDTGNPARQEVAGPTVIEDDVSGDLAYRFSFVGVGQCGGRIAEQFWELGYRRVLAINTTHTDLDDLLDDLPKLDLETGGAGKDMDYGEASVTRHAEKIYEALERAWGAETDYALICAGLGGGTGGGAAGKLIEVVQRFLSDHGDEPRRAGAIVSLPQSHEGQRVCRNAVNAFERVLQSNPSPLIVIDNERINALYRVGASQFYQQANQVVSNLLHTLNRLAAQRSNLLTFDRADFATLLDAGLAVLGASEIREYDTPAAISAAIAHHLERTVLAEVDLSKGKAAACIFVAGETILANTPLDTFAAGYQMLDRMLATDGSVVHRGVYQGVKERLQCITMVSGLPIPRNRLLHLAGKGGVAKSDMAAFLGVDD